MTLPVRPSRSSARSSCAAAILVAVALVACSPETPAPPPPPAPTATHAAQPAPTLTATSVPELQKGTYDEAMLWLRSTRGFRFQLREGKLRAEGEMTRKTPGLEKVHFRAGGEEWLAESATQGVIWKRRSGGAWKEADMPAYGARVYQYVTVAVDPQKKEGVPLLESTEGASNLYRFTNANSGDVHQVWVRKSDSSIERIRIGDGMELTFAP